MCELLTDIEGCGSRALPAQSFHLQICNTIRGRHNCLLITWRNRKFFFTRRAKCVRVSSCRGSFFCLHLAAQISSVQFAVKVSAYFCFKLLFMLIGVLMIWMGISRNKSPVGNRARLNGKSNNFQPLHTFFFSLRWTVNDENVETRFKKEVNT